VVITVEIVDKQHEKEIVVTVYNNNEKSGLYINFIALEYTLCNDFFLNS
jgi:hypothetical protein